MKHLPLFCFLAIIFSIITACQKKTPISDSWPSLHEIYSDDGSVFRVEKCRKDTLCFRLEATQPGYPPFFNSGTLYWDDDTMFFRHWAGTRYDPLFILEMNLDDSVCVEHPYSFKSHILQEELLHEGTIDLLVVKKDTFTVSNDLVHVFDVRRETAPDYRFILSEKKGILGLWVVYPESAEFEGLRPSEMGLGWLPGAFHLSRD